MPNSTSSSEPMEHDYTAVIGSHVNTPVLQALCQAADGIPVRLAVEPDDPADPPAIVILLSSRTLQRLLDITPVPVDGGQSPPLVRWRLGYLSDADTLTLPGLAGWNRARDGYLTWTGSAWTVRVAAAPEPDANRPV